MAQDMKKSFVLYHDYKKPLALLTDEERGKLFMALLAYDEDENATPELEGAALMAFEFIRAQMQRDAEKYAATVKKRKEAGKKGGRPANVEKNIAEQIETDEDTACELQDEETTEDAVHTAPPAPTKEEQQTTQNQRFMEFWNAYPKKIGKKAAQSAWRKAKPDTALFSQIMQAVALAKTSDQWQREGGQFIPNPATWINQGRWDDELSQRVLCSQPITGNPFADALLESQTKGDEPF